MQNSILGRHFGPWSSTGHYYNIRWHQTQLLPWDFAYAYVTSGLHTYFSVISISISIRKWKRFLFLMLMLMLMSLPVYTAYAYAYVYACAYAYVSV